MSTQGRDHENDQIQRTRSRLERLEQREEEINLRRGWGSSYSDPSILRLGLALLSAELKRLVPEGPSEMTQQLLDESPPQGADNDRRGVRDALVRLLIEHRPDLGIDPILSDDEVQQAYGNQLRGRKRP